jgi:amino acid adenylation domain-containing protein/non-ribosomal peptide synthase protein (TIGR01720 family)
LIGYRLSPQQERLWTLLREGLDPLPFRAQCALEIAGDLGPDRALRAAQQVIARHEILHARFRYLPGTEVLVQTLDEPAEIALATRAADDAEDPGEFIDREFAELLDQPCGLDAGAALHVRLLVPQPGRRVLLLAASALRLDGPGILNLAREIAREAAGTPPDAVEEPAQYADLAEWQQELLEQDAGEGRGFWRAVELPPAGSPALPWERQTADPAAFEPDFQSRQLGPERQARVDDLAAALKATPADVLLAAWQALLWRLANGAVTAAAGFDGRRYEGLPEAVGVFARVLPLDARPEAGLGFDAWVRRIHRARCAAAEWQELFAWDRLTGAAGDGLLFFPYAFETANLPAAVLRLYSCGDRFKIKLRCLTRADGLTIELHYDRRLLPEEDARRFADSWERLLDGALAVPATPLDELELLAESERRRLLVDWNRTAAAYPRERCQHELLAEACRSWPDRIAVTAGAEALTYAELDRRAAALALRLRRLGVGPEVVVAVFAERSPEMLVGLLAVWQAGGAYLPLDPSHPADRLLALLAESQAPVLLASVALLPVLPAGHRAQVVPLRAEAEPVPMATTTAPPPDADSLAYVLYTSGSTGRPKGVMIPHRGLVNYLSWSVSAYGLAAGQGAPVHSPLGFDLTVTSLFAPLLAGRTVALLPEAPGVEALAAALRSGKEWSLVKLTPAHLELLGPIAGEPGVRARALILGGEALHGAALRGWRERAPDVRLVNEYGPTETVVGCCVHEIPPGLPEEGAVPIGRPIANTQLYVVDRHLRPVPAGTPGELLIGGDGVARGYLRRPEQTAAAFVPDALSGLAGERLYRTGDLVRHLPNLDLEYLGRIDRQVKIRGFRIEPGEVEAVLAAHPAVREVAVVPREEAGERYLAAYVVRRPGMDLDLEELRGFLRDRLPEPLVPAAWTTLPALPLTANGKVDRGALPAPATLAAGDEGLAPPATAVEEIVAGLWADVLRRDRVGANESFFDLGGHSLLATQVISRIKEAFHVELPLRSLFDAPTLAAFARRVETALQAAPGGEPPAIVAAARDADLPVSFAQQRLLFLEALTPGTTLYHVPVATRIDGELRVDVLERSFSELARRQESLRTTFGTSPQGDVQVIGPARPVTVPLVDLAGLPSVRREEEALHLVGLEARRRFDLRRGPLLRAALLRLGAQEHVAVVTMHHIVTDGWSIGVLVHELAVLVSAFGRGETPTLPELRIQYADFAAWQRSWLRGEVLAEQLDYWRRQLGTASAPLQLPTDRPRAVVRSWHGRVESFLLPRQLQQGLRALCRERRVTLFMALLAAFDALLQRYTGQDDLVVGTPIANRHRGELEPLIGFFVNTLALRADLRKDPDYRTLLEQIRDLALGAYAHQDLPFETLVEYLHPERDLRRTPLFQVMFAVQNAPVDRLEVPGLSLRLLDVATGASKFDWTVSLSEDREGLTGSLEYASDLFDRATVQRVIGHLEILLAAALADPAGRLSELPLLSAAERHHLLLPAAAGAGLELPGTLHGGFEAVVDRSPDEVAVACGERRLTYRELDEAANRLARRLRRLGVGPEVRVALCVERSLEMVIAIVGILKAGGAYVPLDPTYPTERLAFALADTAAPVVVCQEPLRARLPAHGARVLCLDDPAEELGRESPARLDGGAVGACAVYAIYTSGSTGQPKGVVVTHDNAVRLFTTTWEDFRFDASDVWTLFHSFAFDFSVWEIWGALLFGGRLVVVPYLTSRSPEEFHRLLRDERVTVLNQTPSAFRQLIRADETAASAGLDLRLVIFGGEALELESLRPWFDRHGDRRPQLVNMYGITETTVHVTYRPISAADLESGGSPIGGALADLRLHLLDPSLELVPFGVWGELCVGGAGVARGYLHRPELTAERFIPDPFCAVHGEPGARLYRSGDLGRRVDGGEVQYLGRRDHQVKVRGFRLELGEIETALASHPAVREAVVAALGEGSGERRLVAYVVPRDGALPVETLREHLQGKLPDHAIPAAFVLLDRIPLTAIGKVDRRALPLPDGERPQLEIAYEEPRSVVEKVLAGVWARALAIERVGVHDNYFALGGDSIRSLALLAAAREKGLSFTLQQLFRAPTVAGLARELQLGGGVEESLQVPPFALVSAADRERLPAGLEDAYPLTQLQAGMLFHMTQAADSAAYHNVNSTHLRGRFVAEPFSAAVQQVVDRHPLLRTAFDLATYSEPLQLVYPTASLPVAVEDFRHLDIAGQEAALAALVGRERARRFDLGFAPQMRLHVAVRAEDEFQLTVTENHAILDGWSLHSALREIFDRYVGLLDGASPAAEPPPTASLRDYVHLEREALASAEARRYWAEALAGATPLEIPRWPGAMAAAEGPLVRDRRVPASPAVFAGLGRLADSLAVPIKSLLLAAHLKFLSLVCGRMDVITGVTSHGRPEGADSEKVLGLFLNTLPLRLQLGGGTWEDLIRKTFAAEQAMLPFRRYPLAALQKEWGGGRPLFDTQFNYVHFHVVGGMLRSGRLEVLGARKAEETNLALLAGFHVNPRSSEIALELNWSTRHFPPAQAAAMARLYARVLEAMATAPGAPHDGPFWLLPAECQQLLVEWNDTAAPPAEVPGDLPVHRRFQEQARRSPSALALAFGGGSLTYGELEAHSNRLARELQSLGVGPEALVAVCIESPPEWIVALLATLKAGGAYVPLDPAYPGERLRYMLADARPAVLLSEERLAGHLPPLAAGDGPSLLLLDAERDRIERWSDGPLASAVDDDGLVYVIYTSGSTGRPKGVEVPHRGLSNLVRWHLQTYGVTAADRATQVAGPGFDAAVWEIWPYLTAGASLWFPDAAVHTSPPEIVRWLRQEAITLSFLPTPVAETVLLESWPPDMALRVLLTGGDRLRRTAPAEAPFRLVNHYGPTENSVVATAAALPPMPLAGSGQILPPIGRPIDGCRIFLLGPTGQLTATGAPGEMHIAGASLARGYRSQPDRTAESFVPDPFSGLPGSRLYRTGDLARFLPDGSLEFLGRRDAQVKIRGVRIELGEIEATLLAAPGVREAVVVAREEAGGRRTLVGYVVPEEPTGPAAPVDAELRAWLRARLPEAMIPPALVFLAALPLTPNGKIDRHALPEPAAGPFREGGAAPPRTPAEETLAVIWSEVLRLEGIGVHDNFFELGGDSILSLQIVAKAHRAGLRLAANQVFEHPTIAELAAVAGRGPEIDAEQEAVVGPVPLTPIQRWFFERELPDPHHYNQAVLLVARNRLDAGRLERVVDALLRQHDAFRLRFEHAADGWTQFNAAPGAGGLGRVDLGALPPRLRAPALEACAEALQSGFDLARGPLLRVVLFEPGEGEPQRLFILVHHLAGDAVSWRILLQDLDTAYRQLARGQVLDLGPKTTSFRRWSQRLAEHAASAAVSAELERWLAVGREPVPPLPVDHPGGPADNRTGSVRYVAVTLGAEETRLLLREVPEVYHTQINDVLLTALARAFERWTGSPRLRVHLEGHGREEFAEDLDVSRTVGWFTTMFPVLLEVGDARGPGEALKAVKEQLRRVPSRGFSYGLLRYLADPGTAASLREQPPAEISFNYLGQFDETLPGEAVFLPAAESPGLLHSPRQPRPHLLEVGGSVRGGVLRIVWEYSELLHRRETVEWLAHELLAALRELIDHCLSPEAGGYTPSDFPDVELDSAQLAKVLDELESV